MMGTTTPALADRPARLNALVYMRAVVLIRALASSMGAAGSNARSPQLKLLTTVAMFIPVGMGQYAPGSSSCAEALNGISTSAPIAGRTNAHEIRLT